MLVHIKTTILEFEYSTHYPRDRYAYFGMKRWYGNAKAMNIWNIFVNNVK